MKYLLLLVVCFCAGPSVVCAQHSEPVDKQTSFYFEGLGNGGLYSVNVDQLMFRKVAFRAGIARWSAGDFWGASDATYLTVPLVASYLVGNGNRKFEAGFGFLLGRSRAGAFDERQDAEIWASLTGAVGYRYQRRDGGISFRVGLTPFYGLASEGIAYPDKGFFLSGGISIGYALKGQTRENGGRQISSAS